MNHEKLTDGFVLQNHNVNGSVPDGKYESADKYTEA